jgi:hypothetical protein
MSSITPESVQAAIWEITKLTFNTLGNKAYESAISAYDSLGSKSTWNTVQGSSFQNIIGLPLGGRVNNVMGNDVRIVCPWWNLLKRLYSGPDSEAGWFGLVTGIGGDTDMVFGKKTYFTYFSDSVNFEFSNNKIKANYQVPEGVNIDGFSIMGARGLYYAPAIAAVLGALTLTAAILCLKHIWKFSSSDIVGNNASVMKWSMLLVPQIESQLLYLVKFLHTMGYSAIPLKIEMETGVIKEAYEKSDGELQIITLELKNIEEKIEEARSLIKVLKKEISELEKSIINPELIPLKIGQILEQIRNLEWDLLFFESEQRLATEKIVELSAQAIEDAKKLASLVPKP